MVTVKLLSIHADNEQTLDERNTLLTVRARQAQAGGRRGAPRGCSFQRRQQGGPYAVNLLLIPIVLPSLPLGAGPACRGPQHPVYGAHGG